MMTIESCVRLEIVLSDGRVVVLDRDLWGKTVVPEVTYKFVPLNGGGLKKGVIDFEEDARARLQAVLDACFVNAVGDPWSTGKIDVTDFDSAILREVEIRKKDIEW